MLFKKKKTNALKHRMIYVKFLFGLILFNNSNSPFKSALFFCILYKYKYILYFSENILYFFKNNLYVFRHIHNPDYQQLKNTSKKKQFTPDFNLNRRKWVVPDIYFFHRRACLNFARWKI